MNNRSTLPRVTCARWVSGNAIAILFLAMLLPPIGQANTTPATIHDPENDVELRSSTNQTLTRLSNTHNHLDLLGVWISNETKDEFEVGLRLKSWAGTADPPALANRVIRVGFQFGNVSYDVRLGVTGSSCSTGKAILAITENEDLSRWSPIECINATLEATNGLVHFFIPKRLVHGGNLIPVQPGDLLTGLYATTRQSAGAGTAQDRAPDNGHGPPFSIQVGRSEQRGAIFLIPVIPIRASNGESTTMVFPVKATNRADADDVLAISVAKVEAGWTTRVPARIKIAAEETITFPVILTMNFSHEHGRTEFFQVRADSTRTPGSFAAVDLGIHWLSIPQPAGHHDKIWLHSSPRDTESYVTIPSEIVGSKETWANAIEKDPRPNANDANVVGAMVATSPTETVWRFSLNPALQIGMAIDATREGTFETRVRSFAPATQATLEVQINYCDPSRSLPGAVGYECSRAGKPGSLISLFAGKSQPRPLTANQETSFALTLTPNASAPPLPFIPGGNLAIGLTLKTDSPQGSYTLYRNPPSTELVTKASLVTLPLHEYHDPVDQTFQDVGTLRLQALDEFEKGVNPGRGAVFRFDLTNLAAQEQTVLLSLEGINRGWAHVKEGDELKLKPNARQQITVVIDVPHDAAPGERAELFLVAESAQNPNVVSLARLRAAVVAVETTDIPDETPSLSKSPNNRNTSGPSMSAFLLAIGGIGLLFRRADRK